MKSVLVGIGDPGRAKDAFPTAGITDPSYNNRFADPGYNGRSIGTVAIA